MLGLWVSLCITEITSSSLFFSCCATEIFVFFFSCAHTHQITQKTKALIYLTSVRVLMFLTCCKTPMWLWEILPLNFLLFCSVSPLPPPPNNSHYLLIVSLCKDYNDFMSDCDCVLKRPRKRETPGEKCVFDKEIKCGPPEQHKSP